MRGFATFTFFACLVAAGVAQAAAVDVTVEASKETINIGETGTLTVYGQLGPAFAVAGNGIFGWDVDLRIADPTIVELLPASFKLGPDTATPDPDDTIWTRNPLTSSMGTPTAWGLDAIYYTGEDANDLGLADMAELFSIQYRGLADGMTTLSVEPDITSGADFVTWLGDSGGDYSGASVEITVPEPATLALLGFGSLLVLRRHSR